MPLALRVVSLAALLSFACSVAAESIEDQRRDIMQRLDAVESNKDGLTEDERLAAIVDLYYDYTLLTSPEFATYIGLPQGLDRWSDNSPKEIKRQEKDARRGLKALRTVDESRLSKDDRLTYRLLLDQLESQVDSQAFGGNYLQVSQLGGPQQNIAQLLAVAPLLTRADAEAAIARLKGIPAIIDNTIVWLERGLKKGVTPPAITLRDVPQQVKNQIPENALESPLLQKFVELPDSIPAESHDALRESAVAAYNDGVRPAMQRLHDFLADEYLPGARTSIAMSDLPDGEEWYAFRVQQMTTTDMTPQEIHDLGQQEVKRIRGEMERIILQTEFSGTFQEFLDFLRTDEQFYFDSADELLMTYRDIAKRADAALLGLFGTLPRTPYGVDPVPAYAEKSQTTAYYQPGSLEGGRAGTFFANTYKLDTRPKWEMEALTLHEAVPGHHLQIALQQELGDVAWFRRYGGYTAFVEGWGLYSESLGDEMGFYTDPYSKFGQLTYEMWRAIRLVVDTGMHSLGWSRQQAIDFFKANTGKTEQDIVVEVDRYIVMPAQALAYKIGELKIKELRSKAESELGENFNIRAFHDHLLGAGSLPLTILETRMTEWVETQREAVAG